MIGIGSELDAGYALDPREQDALHALLVGDGGDVVPALPLQRGHVAVAAQRGRLDSSVAASKQAAEHAADGCIEMRQQSPAAGLVEQAGDECHGQIPREQDLLLRGQHRRSDAGGAGAIIALCHNAASRRRTMIFISGSSTSRMVNLLLERESIVCMYACMYVRPDKLDLDALHQETLGLDASTGWYSMLTVLVYVLLWPPRWAGRYSGSNRGRISLAASSPRIITNRSR